MATPFTRNGCRPGAAAADARPVMRTPPRAVPQKGERPLREEAALEQDRIPSPGAREQECVSGGARGDRLYRDRHARVGQRGEEGPDAIAIADVVVRLDEDARGRRARGGDA